MSDEPNTVPTVHRRAWLAVLAAGVVALAGGWWATAHAWVKRSETNGMNTLTTGAPQPPIDAAVPKHLETATFALG